MACAGAPAPAVAPPPAPRKEPPARSPKSGTDTLLDLADRARASGDTTAAHDRYTRVLVAEPTHARAHTGLAKLALESGSLGPAREHFESALASDPRSADALLGLEDLEEREGNPRVARELIERAVDHHFGRADAHARLAALTGPAPRSPIHSGEAAVARAANHPYDPWVLLRAGESLAREGRPLDAAAVLEKVVWLADLDPSSAAAALQKLPELDPRWQSLRAIPVYVWVDESLRRTFAWRYRLRLLFLAASHALAPVLDARFVLVSIGAFATRGVAPDLDAIFDAFRLRTTPPPRHGILAAFTARPAPKRGTERKQGLAEFLGRRLVVRLPSREAKSRVLAHELLHVFGAIHVSPELKSIMNPSGQVLKLDRPNLRIVQTLRERDFGPGGIGRNIVARVDLDDLIDVYRDALGVNLAFRRAGVVDAMQSSRLSRFLGARRRARATQLDPHLAEVSRMLSQLMLADDRPGESLLLLDLSARLYGLDTRKGRAVDAEADALRVKFE